MLKGTLALLADGDGDTRVMYAEYLALLQWRTDEAEDGQEALAKAIAHRPSVIVTEARLPGLSGLELCRQLRSEPATGAIPIIILTGHALAHELALAQAADPDAVLTKPCLPMDLVAEATRVLAGAALQTVAPSRMARESSRRLCAVGDDRRASACMTIAPPMTLERFVCPKCSQSLSYLESHIGAVGHYPLEQWDYFSCVTCRATYEHRQRTQSLRACLTGLLPISEVF